MRTLRGAGTALGVVRGAGPKTGGMSVGSLLLPATLVRAAKAPAWLPTPQGSVGNYLHLMLMNFGFFK